MSLIYYCHGMILGMGAQVNAFTYSIYRQRQLGRADSSVLNVVLDSRAANMTHMNRCAMGQKHFSEVVNPFIQVKCEIVSGSVSQSYVSPLCNMLLIASLVLLPRGLLRSSLSFMCCPIIASTLTSFNVSVCQAKITARIRISMGSLHSKMGFFICFRIFLEFFLIEPLLK